MKDKDNRKELLKDIRDEVVRLKSSPLYAFRIESKNYPVIGEGNHYTDIMFVGEAPGRNEAKTGKPFCGAAGKILDELLDSVKIKRDDVYVTNIVKDRPPKNRDPIPEEIEVYAPFLDRQIEIIKPRIIATLGRFSMKYIMERFGLTSLLGLIGEMHGKHFETDMSYGKVVIVPLYHPAVAVYNSNTKDTLKEDFKILTKLLK